MNNLLELSNKYNTDKGYKHNYPEIYQKYFDSIKDKSLNILEIGVLNGASIRMWLDYFSQSHIYGLDIDILTESISDIDRTRFSIFEGDQSNVEVLLDIVENCPDKFDIIIDDGSHNCRDQSISLSYLFRRLKPGGLYIIEDLDVKESKSNTPKMIKTISYFLLLKKFINEFISSEDCYYLEQHIDSCKVFNKKICFIRKAE